MSLSDTKRGIVLVTSLVLLVVALMFIGATLALGPANLGMGLSSLNDSHAARAAESGLQYALARLKASPSWRGDLNQVTVNRPDLYVVEDRGNVVGLIRTPDGGWGQFRIRFNYQDGPAASTPDNLDDPGLFINHSFVSVNNLLNGADAPVYRADGSNYSVTPTSATAFRVPIWSVSLAVEGRYSPSLSSQLGPGNPNPNVSGVPRKVVEAIYQVPDMGDTVEESGSMSGRDFTVELDAGGGGKVEVKSKSAATPRVRAKGKVEVTGGNTSENYQSDNGEVRTINGFNALFDPTKVNAGIAENPADQFYELGWAKVKKADPAAAQKLPAGTYVWWDDGTLHYYDKSYDDYVAFITTPANATNPGTVVTSSWLPTGVQLDANKHKLTFTESIYVESSGTPPTDEFNVVARLGAPDAPPGDPEAAGNDAAIAAAIAGDPTMLANFMSSTQASSADIDISNMSGTLISDIDWSSTNGFNDPVDPPVTYAMMIQMMANPTSVPGYQFNYAGESINFVAVDLQQIAATAPWYTGPAGGDDGKIPVPSVADSLSAADLEIEFKPADGEQAVLTAEGSVRLTSAISGKNGSITSGGDIKITGLGAQFSASEQSGVNMYARGDIVFSTLDEKTPGD
ncbi:MAG: hypothetical protein AB1758_25120, partial [Candidatus Eremiobacterota bacterium]